jgi:hypothetical protein
MTIPTAPHDTIGTEDLLKILELTCRAPSLHNSQPWRWVFERGILRLYADHARVGRHTDITGREVILSCGAALDHMRVASAAAGWQVSVDRNPDKHDHNHLASMAFQSAGSVTAQELALGDAISRRRTDRLAFAAPEPWTELEERLRATVDGTVAELDVVDDNGRPALADASRRSEEHRRDDASYAYELLWWTGHSHVGDGIPPGALPSTTEASRVDVARNFPIYRTEDRHPEVDRDHSKVLVLSTYDDNLDNTLRCGEVLSRVLLECTARGFATCTLTHMIEVHASREDIRRITGQRAEPQVLIRVGNAPQTNAAAARTPRRPLGEVIEIR